MKIVIKKMRDIKNPMDYIIAPGRLKSGAEVAHYLRLLREYGLLIAIKYLKDTTGLGLKECKDVQDHFRYVCYMSGYDLGKSEVNTDNPIFKEWLSKYYKSHENKTEDQE